MRILFVCHGNICRSPMAEFIMKDLVAKQGREDDFFIASAATSAEEIGHGVYRPARAELAKHGIGCEGKRSVRLQRSDYDKYDLLIGMDEANIGHMRRICGGDSQGKIRKLLDYTHHGGDVADPWYTGRFDVAYRDIYEGCTALLKTICPR